MNVRTFLEPGSDAALFADEPESHDDWGVEIDSDDALDVVELGLAGGRWSDDAD